MELIYSRSKSRCCFYCSRMRIIHFMCPQGAGGTDAEVKSEMLDELAAWLEAVVLNLAESRRLRDVVGKVDTYRTKVELPSKMNSG